MPKVSSPSTAFLSSITSSISDNQESAGSQCHRSDIAVI
jgi:hypothetical protein